MAQSAQKQQEQYAARTGDPSANRESERPTGGIVAALKGMWRAGGVWGLYQGLPAELVRGLLFQAILMATKEKLDTANHRLVARLGRVSGTQ